MRQSSTAVQIYRRSSGNIGHHQLFLVMETPSRRTEKPVAEANVTELIHAYEAVRDRGPVGPDMLPIIERLKKYDIKCL